MAKQKKSNKMGIVIIVIFLVSILWGLPSMIRGQGFMNGIFENINAIIYLGGFALIGFFLFKVFSK